MRLWPDAGCGDGWDLLTPEQQQTLMGDEEDEFDVPDRGSPGVRRWFAWLDRKTATPPPNLSTTEGEQHG